LYKEYANSIKPRLKAKVLSDGAGTIDDGLTPFLAEQKV
jgi:hypothetical protein